MAPLLFVYGTLKREYTGLFGRDMRDRLHRESRFLGPATMGGRLYDLGSYPGVLDPLEPGDIVHGEVVELLDPAESLIWLDSYEGILPGALAASEYRREQRPVRLPQNGQANVTELTAWVYIYARDVAGVRSVDGGNWQPA